ncbi:MAG: hypothetical protein U0L45_00045 [Alistipes sp.]|nr:hypothetical protein [Alistipes sp.]
MVQIRITASIKKLGETSVKVLTEAAEAVGLDSVTVTSTQRPPRVQAEAMLYNIEHNHNIRYKWAGQQVIDLARKMRGAKEARVDIIDAMTAKIEELSAMGDKYRVSNHCVSDAKFEKRNVIDVSYRDMPEDKQLLFLGQMVSKPEVVKVIQPLTREVVGFDMGEPALHFEIEQA